MVGIEEELEAMKKFDIEKIKDESQLEILTRQCQRFLDQPPRLGPRQQSNKPHPQAQLHRLILSLPLRF